MLLQAALPFAGDEPERVRNVVSAVIEVGLLTWFFYGLLRFLHGKAGLAVLKGVLITLFAIIISLAAVHFLLELSFPRLQVAGTYMLPFLIVVLVVLFQPELRRGFLKLSEAGSLGGRGVPGQVSDLAAAFRALSRRQNGALVVFERQTGIKGVQDTGVPLDAALSGALLESIFYPKSPLHDGAVIVRGNRIVAACCMLPLTERTGLSRDLGTRHRAAIGVTEESDAVAVVVSEESGRIALVHRGTLHPVADESTLDEMLADYLEGVELESS
jgi:diadenylate cyclase